MRMLGLLTSGLLLAALASCGSSPPGSVSPSAGSNFALTPNRQEAYAAGLRGPRTLRSLRSPRPYTTRQPRRMKGMPTASSGPGLALSPAGQTGSLTLGRTTFAWSSMARTLHIYSGLPQATVPHTTQRRGKEPYVSYDPISDTWTFK